MVERFGEPEPVDTGTRFGQDRPAGFAPTVLATDDAAKLCKLSSWPRMVAVIDDADLVHVERAWQRGDDPGGSVRLTLGRRDGVQQHLLGAGEACVAGALPSRWWGWRTRDGAPLLHPDRVDVDASMVDLCGLWRDPTHRDVLLLGGPQDGDVLTTDCQELEMPGVWVQGRWYRPRDVDRELVDVQVRHVYYRVRRVADLDRAGPWWDEGRLAGRDWVATFEGERGVELPGEWQGVGPGAERERLIALVADALGEHDYPGGPDEVERDARLEQAAAAVLAMLGDPAVAHAQGGGEADPDEVLVDVVAALQGVQVADASALVEQGLAVLRALEADYTIHPRPAS